MTADDDAFPAWQPMDGGATLGQRGTEGGVILRDDEHPWGARITLEEPGMLAPFGITCGVYGWFGHTRWFSTRDDAERDFAAMRDALGAILRIIPLEKDPEVAAKRDAVGAAFERFTDRFP